MKLIKKIAAIMFAFMMVFTLSSNVNAEETTGTITVENPIEGQTYKAYKILDLESYDLTNKLYSYKISKGWEAFFQSTEPKGAGSDYITINENNYVTFNDGVSTEQFAKSALTYAEKNHISAISPSVNENVVTFNDLELGYYLLDSSAGALCGLDTTNSEVKIREKNGVPEVHKTIINSNHHDDTNSYASIGDKVQFKTVITAQPGAQNYVLHDTMDDSFTYNKDVEISYKGSKLTLDDEYTINYDDPCTFDIVFKEKFLNTLSKDDEIVVTYSAILNGNAHIETGNINKTHLTYGSNKNTAEKETVTTTYQIKVLKYTKSTDNPLGGATFSLYNAANEGTAYQLVKKQNTEEYRLALSEEAPTTTKITTTSTGKFSIQGLKPGDYWLEETEAPKGYNKLAKRIKVTINEYGSFLIDGKGNADNYNLPYNQVDVENKSGSLLPQTGGAGTTLIYLIGGALVLGSGFVLANKKRAKAK